MSKRTRAFMFLIGLTILLLISALMKKSSMERVPTTDPRTGAAASIYMCDPVGLNCRKCGSARRTSISDNRILMQKGFPSGLGDHPTPVPGLSYRCLDCGEVIVVYPSHWHASPQKAPCPLCKRALSTEGKK